MQIRSVFERAAAEAAKPYSTGIDTEIRISSLKADLHGPPAAQACLPSAAGPDQALGRIDAAAEPATGRTCTSSLAERIPSTCSAAPQTSAAIPDPSAAGKSQAAVHNSRLLADKLEPLPAVQVGSVPMAQSVEKVNTGDTAAAKQCGPAELVSGGSSASAIGAPSAAASSRDSAELARPQMPASADAKQRSMSAPPIARGQPLLPDDGNQKSSAPPASTESAVAAETTRMQNEGASQAQTAAAAAAHLAQPGPAPVTAFNQTLEPYEQVLQAVGIQDQAADRAHIYQEQIDLWVKFMASSLKALKPFRKFYELLDTFDKEFELAELLRECELETAPLESPEIMLEPYIACLAANGKTLEGVKTMKSKSIENWVRSVAMRDNTINGFPTLLNTTVKQFKLYVAIKEYLEE